jgi:DNA-binding transcriptional LysR family regulator
MNIELRHLKYFVAVAEEASFTAAAQRVHVAQQVLSTQIRQLEDVVGTQLLNRTNKGVTLTPAGAAFLTTARETLAGLDRGVAAARNAARAVAGKLIVGVGPGCENETRTRLLTAFERAYAEVEMSIQSFDMTQPSAGLLDHSSDVALVRPPVAAPAIELAQVRSEPRVFVLPVGHPLAAREQLSLSASSRARACRPRRCA